VDFAALLELEANGAGLELESERVEVSDGLNHVDLGEARTRSSA
jgi:hypothetical protein